MRDGRAVYIGAERVDDVTAHPAFREGAKTIAGLYDLKADPAQRDLFSFEEDGERISLYWLRCRSRDDLVRRMRAMKAIADATYGFVGRSPDQVSGLVTGLAMNAGLLEKLHAGLRPEPAALLRARAPEGPLSQLRRDAGERQQERRSVSRPAARRSQPAGRRRGRCRRHGVRHEDAGDQRGLCRRDPDRQPHADRRRVQERGDHRGAAAQRARRVAVGAPALCAGGRGTRPTIRCRTASTRPTACWCATA